MKLRKRLGIWLSLALVASLLGCSSSTVKTEGGTAGATYKIGVDLELTGGSSVWGVPQKNAIEMLVKEINEKGGINGVPIELIVYDNESSETQALIVAKKMVEQDQVLAIIGGGTTPTTMPIVPYVTQQQVPLVSVGSGDGITSPVNEREWIFKTPSNNRDIAKSIVSFLKQKGKTSVAFLSMNNAYGESGKQAFEALAKEEGIAIIAAEKFGAGDKDMKPQLTNIKAKNPDAIIVWAIPPSASIVNRNFWELKMDQMLIYSAGAGANAFIDLAGREAAEGTYIASGKVWVADQLDGNDPQQSLLTKYVKDYESSFQTGVSPIDGMAYDAALLVTKAIEMSTENVTRQSIRDNLEKIQGLVGATGIFNMSPNDHTGLKPEDVIILQVQNGEWVIAK
ncbi:ABC transporter substrate-binding protein [Brevibacillus panacihumi]|uniref:ABC transporter substrate-binding protein n=1 Tax=Brevibacillus panacihumi TaxID=497735 RepID=UPI003D024E64